MCSTTFDAVIYGELSENAYAKMLTRSWKCLRKSKAKISAMADGTGLILMLNEDREDI